MTEYVRTRNPRMAPLHPGQALADIVASLDLPVARRVALIRIAHDRLDAIVAGGAPVSPIIARRLGQALGKGARLQSQSGVRDDFQCRTIQQPRDA